jgi:hypothetical protein
VDKPKHEDDLEDLLSEALLQAGQATRRAAARPQPASRLAFTDPLQWVASGQVALVHREGTVDTLVGLFDEFYHAVQKSARKLVATQLSAMKPRIEYVTGDHWIGKALEAKRRTPDSRVQIVEDLVLDMGVSAPAVVCECSIVGGGVARVTLAEATRFEAFTPRTILLLPAGMDVLEGLSRGTKERIWTEVKRILGVSEDA